MKPWVWSDWSLFSNSIQNTFLSSQKKTAVICPEMGENNAFPNDKAVCFEKWIYWDDKSGFFYLLTCLSSGELSLFILLHWKGWNARQFQKSDQKLQISVENNDSSTSCTCGISMQEHFLVRGRQSHKSCGLL